MFTKKQTVTKDVNGLPIGISLYLFVAEVAHSELTQKSLWHNQYHYILLCTLRLKKIDIIIYY
jgi:hypothetical protein